MEPDEAVSTPEPYRLPLIGKGGYMGHQLLRPGAYGELKRGAVFAVANEQGIGVPVLLQSLDVEWEHATIHITCLMPVAIQPEQVKATISAALRDSFTAIVGRRSID